MDIKKISIVLGIIVVMGGGFIGYGRLQARQEVSEERIEEAKAALKEAKVEIKENRNINIEQTILLNKSSVIMEHQIEAIKEFREALR